MSTHIVVQMGHCFRKTGATGTTREQEFASKVGPKLRDALVARGHKVTLIGADEPVPRSNAFIALHTDGSSNPKRRGGSVGYPDAKSGILARAWKRAHQRNGYSAGFHPDNYTAALGGYYGFRKAVAEYEFLAEHGFTTNPEDQKWLFDNIDSCVMAHVEAIGEVIGHPRPLAQQIKENGMAGQFKCVETLPENGVEGRLYAVSGDRIIHLDWNEFLSFVALDLFENAKNANGFPVMEKRLQVQVDYVAGALKKTPYASRT